MLERQLSDIWRLQSFGGELLTDGGERVAIIYPGRVNDNKGGDFCDAVIAFPDRTVMGDVELHMRSADWRGHRHDRDPGYNNVVLHVVYANNSNSPTTLENGCHVPVLALEGHVVEAEDAGHLGWPTSRRLCFNAIERLGESARMGAIEVAGEERLARRMASYLRELETVEPGQVLYQGIMTVLGYSRNKAPFLELARRLPLASLEGLSWAGDEYECFRRKVEACLLCAAGFGPLRRDDNERSGFGLQRMWTITAPPLKWQALRARPSNSPSMRIKAMSYLVTRYRRWGLLPGLLRAVEDAPRERGHNFVERALMVPGEGCTCGSALLGRERAADMAVNVVLPFAVAFGRAHQDARLSDKALSLYRGWPRLATNCVERHMLDQIGLRRTEVNSAVRQQGLIEIYSKLCTHGKCVLCSLGEAKTRDDVKVQAGPAAPDVAEVACGGYHSGVVRA